jgi:hypothetical protein
MSRTCELRKRLNDTVASLVLCRRGKDRDVCMALLEPSIISRVLKSDLIKHAFGFMLFSTCNDVAQLPSAVLGLREIWCHDLHND